MIFINVPLTRYNFPIVYGPKTVFYDLPNGPDRKLVVSNRISLCVLDMDMTAVLWAPNLVVSMHAFSRTFLIQREIVSFLTGLNGF